MNNDYFFLENLSMLIQDGYSLITALEICSKIQYHRDIDFLITCLQEGYSIDEAIAKSQLPSTFKEYFRFFQEKHVLSDSIENSLRICKMQNDYFQKIKKQLAYPMFLLVFMLIFSVFVVFVLLPQVNLLFVSFGLEKSFMIQSVMFLFQIVPIAFIILFIISLLVGIHLYRGLKYKRFKVIEFYLSLPVFKTFLQKYFSLKFAIYYNELLLEKLDTITIIQTLNQQLMQSDIKIVLYEMEQRMMEGELIEDIIEDFVYFDDLLIVFFRMILQHSSRDLSLQNYIDITFNQVEITLNRIMRYLTTGIYLFVALFVIMIYLSIILPMMNIVSDI